MSLMSKLAFRQLKKSGKRTFITLLGVILSVGMITAVAGFVFSMRDMMRTLYISANGDWHVAIYNVTDEQAQSLALDEAVESSFTKTDEKSAALGIHIRLKQPTRAYPETVKELAALYGVEAPEFSDNKELLAVEGVIASDNTMQTVISLGVIIIGIIVVGSILVISNAFNISANERLRQFGLLKSVGATREQVRASVLAEGLVLAALGIPLGLVAGFGIEALALGIANGLLAEIAAFNGDALVFRPVFAAVPLLIAAAVSFVTILLSAWFPARKCSRISAIEAIRLSGEVKLRGKRVRVSRLAPRLFGFEGTLALKALKRDRRKYRATVISLVVSMVLFIASSSFGQIMMKATEIIYTDYGVNVTMSIWDGDDGLFSGLNEKFMALESEFWGFARIAYTTAKLPESFVSESYRKYVNSGFIASPEIPPTVKIVKMDDASFSQLCRSAGIASDAFKGGDVPQGILLNNMQIDNGGKRIEFQPFNFQKGAVLSLSDNEGNPLGKVALAAQATEFPVCALAAVSNESVSIVVPTDAFQSLSKDWRQTIWVAKADDPAAFAAACKSILEGSGLKATGQPRYSVTDIEEMVRLNHNITLLVMIFVYGFIALLSLIGITSVVGTISTGISLRAQEFAMLSSVGMTPEGMRRMLNFESLFYGLRALCFGLPVGLIVSALLQSALSETVQFAFLWPWQSMLISVAAVLLITFITMRYSSKRLRVGSIVETLKGTEIL